MPERNFPPQFKQEVAELVLDYHYTHAQVASQMGVSSVSVQRWVKQLRQERNQQSLGTARALTPETQEIQALRKQLKQAKLENGILKKASALLISGRPKYSRSLIKQIHLTSTSKPTDACNYCK